MSAKEIIEQVASEYAICEYAFGLEKDVPFSEKVRYICETDCERYGKCWACPPYGGAVNANIEKCGKYENIFVFSTVTEVADAWNARACLAVKEEHERISREINARLKAQGLDFLMLSTGCTKCHPCACPDEPCRFPEEQISSMESHGIVIMQLADEMGLSYSYGSDCIVYFGMILFN